ncbi:hypothetical protein OAI12_00200 [Porticoccaceae bacterium]|nr:hypothetical protein [Porticoccaceae bacterium]
MRQYLGPYYSTICHDQSAAMFADANHSAVPLAATGGQVSDKAF